MILDSNAPPLCKASECKTEEQLIAALLYLREITPKIPPKKLHNHEQKINSFLNKLNKLRVLTLECEDTELLQQDRLFYYHRSIVLAVEFLKAQPDTELLAQLFICLTEALKVAGSKWDEDAMYSDLMDFGNAFTKSEKIIFFIHKILQSGLHEKRSIVSIINMYIKLTNLLNLHDKINLPLPSKKSLHSLSFVELKY